MTPIDRIKAKGYKVVIIAEWRNGVLCHGGYRLKKGRYCQTFTTLSQAMNHVRRAS